VMERLEVWWNLFIICFYLKAGFSGGRVGESLSNTVENREGTFRIPVLAKTHHHKVSCYEEPQNICPRTHQVMQK